MSLVTVATEETPQILLKQDPKPNFNLTLNNFYEREIKRRSNGHYVKSGKEYQWTFLLSLLVVGLAGSIFFSLHTASISEWSMSKSLFALATIFIVAYVITKVGLVIRWCLYWMGLAIIVFQIVQAENSPLQINSEQALKGLFYVFVIMEILTVLIWVLTKRAYPFVMLRWARSDPDGFWDVRSSLESKGTFTCRAGLTFKELTYKRARRTFQYNGEMDDLKRPHGFGKFTCSWKAGEIYTGLFDHGIPIGPFKSREFGTGYSFENIQIGFCSVTNSEDWKFKGLEFGPVTYGITSVECSVMGKFFSELPRVSMVHKHTTEDLASNLMHYSSIQPKDSATKPVLLAVKQNRLEVSGYTCLTPESRTRLQIHLDANLDLLISGWERQEPPTALIFIPGFNSSLQVQCISLAQLITLGGGLPANIQPWVFSWPGGTLPKYIQACHVAESVAMREKFREVIKMLQKRGFKRVHVCSHSMGGRVVLNVAQDFTDYFKKHDGESEMLELSGCTFINPEASLTKFVEVSYGQIKLHTNQITIYGNDRDLALNAAELLVQKEPLLGNHVKLLKHHRADVEALDEGYLDLDVVDTTDLDSNVHAAKHSYYNLNKMVVDDLIECVEGGQRASERDTRLLKIEGNWFGFLTAPSYIKAS